MTTALENLRIFPAENSKEDYMAMKQSWRLSKESAGRLYTDTCLSSLFPLPEGAERGECAERAFFIGIGHLSSHDKFTIVTSLPVTIAAVTQTASKKALNHFIVVNVRVNPWPCISTNTSMGHGLLCGPTQAAYPWDLSVQA